MLSTAVCVSVMEKAAQSAREIQLQSFNHPSLASHEKSSHRNLVTEVDISCQKRIVDIITEELTVKGISASNIGFIGEENLNAPHCHTFIIDPLDGTNNFASGFEYFGTSIAYAHNGMILAGVVSHPLRDTLYYASKGKGAWKKKGLAAPRRMSITPVTLEQSLISTSVSSQICYLERLITLLSRLTPLARSIRIMGGGSLDLTLLADPDNAIHGVIYPHLYLWDIAAAWLIVREAGGEFTTLTNHPFSPSLTHPDITEGIIAGHPQIVKRINALLSA